MMKPRYASTGCSAESQESGDAARPVYAWYVNSNNGNANINNRNNDGLALPVSPLASPSGECQGAERVTRRQLYAAWQAARRGKAPSCNKQRWEARWYEEICELEAEINAGVWKPRPTRCFIADAPKTREIHAPDFRDRVVHHLVVPLLEERYEPIFIYDSYANRKGKGIHAAVARLQSFARQQPKAWALKEDIANCFNCIPRDELWLLLKRRMQRTGMPLVYQRIVHAMLQNSPLQAGVYYRATAAERSSIPPHKRLENAKPGCGLPTGNLFSQFGSNVLFNELDQFVKHVLGVKRYLRYVDDFILIHESREQLEIWKTEIARFLRERLRLELKDDAQLKPVADGIDFLGYVVRPSHTLVRRRVVSHAKDKLHAWQQQHVAGGVIRATPVQLREISSVWGSYRGHLQHAASHRLQRSLHRRFPWLTSAAEVRRRFDHRLADRVLEIRV